MTKSPKSDEERAAERARRAEMKRQREEEMQREAKKIRKWLDPLHPRVLAVMGAINVKLREFDEAERERVRLLDHADGFYEEMDKLAKGKALLEVTDLMVQSANEIIADAKALVTGDTYLDRVKQFVPAGSNPVYPDVVVHLRTVRGALSRYEDVLKARREAMVARYWEAATILAGVVAYMENDDWPTHSDAWRKIDDGSKLNGRWFVQNEEGERYFDLERLRTLKLEEYFGVGAASG